MSVTLSFTGGANGAWDDRELVNAYDTAMEEFHLHHPGPGSWLDKMTALEGKGPVAGPSNDRGTAWYSATEAKNNPEPQQDYEEVERPAKRSRNIDQNDGTNQPSDSNPYTNHADTSKFTANPASPQYSPPSPSLSHAEAPTSPRYAPPSPNTRTETRDDSGPSSSAAARPSTQRHFPPPPVPIAILPTASVSPADALQYAMTSQYWAGYWMGVSQALQTGSGEAQTRIDTGVTSAEAMETGSSARSNVITTQHRVLKR